MQISVDLTICRIGMQILVWCIACLLAFPGRADVPASALEAIQADLDQGRLSLPAGRNAMEKIDQYRQQWPTDLSIVPLAYRWADAQLRAAEHAYLYADYPRLQQILEELWWLTPEAPGLDQLQARVDADPRVQLPQQPTAAGPAVVKALDVDEYQPLSTRIARAEPHNRDNTIEILASQDLDAELVGERDKAVEELLLPFCKALIEHRADVRIEAEDRVDYSWLTVRLTLCVRRLDNTFRIRHHYRQRDGAPRLQLYIPRPAAGTIYETYE